MVARALITAALCLSACASTPTPRRVTTRVSQVTPPSRTAPTSTTSAQATPSDAATPTPDVDAEEGNALAQTYAGNAALQSQEGVASYYHDSLAGNHTANGERYRLSAFTCAHRTLPFGTIVRVTRLDRDNATVVVRVNDRGPFGGRGRIIDLSRAAASKIGLIRDGIARVRLDILELGNGATVQSGQRRRRR